MLRNVSLTWTMLILTATVGIVVWAVSDIYQSKELSKIFQQTLTAQLSEEAHEQRTRFDRFVKAFHPSVRLYSGTKAIQSYVNTHFQPGKRCDDIAFHEKRPPWLPPFSVMRRFVMPRYAMLINSEGQVCELYHHHNPLPPAGLLNPTFQSLELAYEQSHLTLFEGKPYLLTLDYVQNDLNEDVRLLIASPVDEEFLMKSQGASATHAVIALLKDNDSHIMVSNNNALIPAGTNLKELEKHYFITGEGFFGSGSFDLLVRFVSFISRDKVDDLAGDVLAEDRRMRVVTALAYITVFGLMIWWITFRIQQLTQRVIDFSQDMEIAQPQLKQRNQLKELESRFELLAGAIRSETEALEHQALHDPLTDLPNRKLLNDRLQHELFRCERNKSCLTLLISDLDRFKEINDTLGHHVGDLVLQEAAKRLRKALRKNDTVARLGGDEFGMLLPDANGKAACTVSEKIVKLFAKPFVIEGHNLNVGISIGIAEHPSHGNDVNILMQRADVAMYNAKQNNTGFKLYNPSEDPHSVSRLALMSDLRSAIEEKSIELFFQPKVDVRTNWIIAAEALLRWKHPERGYIPPDEFIPLAEQTGLIHPLTSWVIDEALYRCSQWHQQGSAITVCLNVSVHSLQNSDFVQLIEKALERHGVPAEFCVIELTESVFLKDLYRAKEILQKVDDLGVGLSIDDFGTGYSSLVYLKQLPVRELKIDRSFVSEMTEDENDAVIVRATIELGHNLGLQVVAEGVEDIETLEQLRALNCDMVQGYLISRPLPNDEFVGLLTESASILPLGRAVT